MLLKAPPQIANRVTVVGNPVRPEVWELYREAVNRFGRVSSLVEWDDRIPELPVVLAERDRAAAIAAEVLA